MQIASETNLTLYEGIGTDDIDQATINAAVQNIKEDIDYDKIATRLLLKTVYRKVIGGYDKVRRLTLPENAEVFPQIYSHGCRGKSSA